MTDYLLRQTIFARAIHWVHTVATVVLFYTGIAIFTPGTNFLVGGPGGLPVSTVAHRVAAIAFIAIPIIGIIMRRAGLLHLFKALLRPWDKQDWLWTKRFVPYMFAARKVHLPPHNAEIKAGQRVVSLGMIAFCVLIGVTGFLLWFDSGVAPVVVRWAALLHDISMIFLGAMLMGHIYLGAGIFQPLRGMISTMFGNGKISYRDALYNWPAWAEEQAAAQRSNEQEKTRTPPGVRETDKPSFRTGR
ncbi:MAG TPA: cytochrome b/b6 domain-containing protein [Thermoleophilia bacterium]|nr:cytochrome b/b6 domain-containing protein [Thermoleophilia bacterium]